MLIAAIFLSAFVAIGRLIEKQHLIQQLDVHVKLLDKFLELNVGEGVKLFPESAADSLLLEWTYLGHRHRIVTTLCRSSSSHLLLLLVLGGVGATLAF